MIKISGSPADIDSLAPEYAPNSPGRKILDIFSSSSNVYNFTSLDQLKFKINLRVKIINASKDLSRTSFSFRVFRKSKCNPDYWIRTDEGGFKLKPGAKPASAIRDIYRSSSKYGTECATAMVIVFYKALADILDDNTFNITFPYIYLMDWQNLDKKLNIVTYRSVPDYLPGDCRYFKNPDVNPETPEWQGENAIDLGNGTYYGHGIGIRNADGIINALNRHREPGSQTSAYLIDSVTRLDFIYS